MVFLCISTSTHQRNRQKRKTKEEEEEEEEEGEEEQEEEDGGGGGRRRRRRRGAKRRTTTATATTRTIRTRKRRRRRNRRRSRRRRRKRKGGVGRRRRERSSGRRRRERRRSVLFNVIWELNDVPVPFTISPASTLPTHWPTPQLLHPRFFGNHRLSGQTVRRPPRVREVRGSTRAQVSPGTWTLALWWQYPARAPGPYAPQGSTPLLPKLSVTSKVSART